MQLQKSLKSHVCGINYENALWKLSWFRKWTLQKARTDKNRDVKWKKIEKRTEEHFARKCEYYLLVTVHLFIKTKNDKENVAIQEKTQSWHEDDRYAEGPRAHSFFSGVFYFFWIFLPVEKRERKVGAYSSESISFIGSSDPCLRCHNWKI